MITKAEVRYIQVRHPTADSNGTCNVRFRFATERKRKPVTVSVHTEYRAGQHPIMMAMYTLLDFAKDYDKRFVHHMNDVRFQFMERE